MPSVASISCTYDRCSHFQEKVGVVFPMIDPLDAYFLLNPGGDLINTEAEFGDWFKDQNFEVCVFNIIFPFVNITRKLTYILTESLIDKLFFSDRNMKVLDIETCVFLVVNFLTGSKL